MRAALDASAPAWVHLALIDQGLVPERLMRESMGRDHALVVLSRPSATAARAVRALAPAVEVIAVGEFTADELDALIAAGVDEVLPVEPRPQDAARLRLACGRAARRQVPAAGDGAGLVECGAILDSVPLGVILLDPARRIARLNATAAVALGGGVAELTGAALDDFVGWEPWATAYGLVAEVCAGAPTASAIASSETDGRAWSLTASPLRSGAAGDRRTILLVRDVSDELRLRRSAELNERMANVGSVVAGVAHEVRNPLFGISAIADALELRLKDSGEPLPHLQMLRTVVARLAKLMNELLVLGSTARLEREPLVVGDVVEEARLSVSHLAVARGVAIELVAASTPIVVGADRSQLAQVLQNLLDNAIRHSPAGAVVTVGASAESGRVLITVRDRGPGFGANRARAFEPFFSRRKDGTGLGLAIVQQIAQRHDGAVRLADHPEGGAVVTVELPLEVRR